MKGATPQHEDAGAAPSSFARGDTPMPMTLSAPAKLNLYLAVGALRSDGYHDVTTVLMALDLADDVTVEPASALSLVCEPDVGVSSERNLAWKAALAMSETFGRPAGFAIRVAKRVPAGAGLGGGSADAAAVIAAIAAAWGVPRDDTRIDAVAGALGADVLFPLHGGCALYEGRGEVLSRRLELPRAHFAIACGPDPVTTADAYTMLDRLGCGPAPGPGRVAAALASGDPAALGGAIHNDMTAAALALVPHIADALACMAETDRCLGSALCGSGSAVFGVFACAADAGAAAAAARQRGLWAATARPRAGGTLDQAMGAGL
jgi:4-diphosphocytidyl-2-C-methyl-D-erythritol kinase